MSQHVTHKAVYYRLQITVFETKSSVQDCKNGTLTPLVVVTTLRRVNVQHQSEMSWNLFHPS